MKKEYNVKKLKVKRRGVLPGLKGKSSDSTKVKITISLDKDVIEHFKTEAEKSGSLPYQTQINQTLRSAIEDQPPTYHKSVDNLKAGLLNDTDFINQVAKLVNKKKS